MTKHTPDRPLTRVVDSTEDESSFGYITLTIRGLNQHDVEPVLKAVRKITGAAVQKDAGEYLVVRGGGRPPWSGSPFVDAGDCVAWLKEAAKSALTKRPRRQPTQQLALSWLADHHPVPEHFRHADPKRITDWCIRAGHPWEAIKREAVAEYDAGFAGVNPPSEAGR
jgi:hypothetical protein